MLLWPNICNHYSLAVTSYRVLEQVSEFALSIRNMISLFLWQCHDNLLEKGERFVNELCLEECWSFWTFFLGSLEPAKSTKFYLLIMTFSADSTLDLISRCTVKTQCDLDEDLLSLCSLIVRLVSPSKSWAIASSSVRHFLIVSPLTCT